MMRAIMSMSLFASSPPSPLPLLPAAVAVVADSAFVVPLFPAIAPADGGGADDDVGLVPLAVLITAVELVLKNTVVRPSANTAVALTCTGR